MSRELFPSFVPKKEVSISDTEARVFELLTPKHEQLVPDPRGFSGTHKIENINRHLVNVEKKRGRIVGREWDVFKRARLLEAILSEHIELSDWFGGDARTVIPTEYDDVYNGIDLAIEFQTDKDPNQTMVIGIDVVSSPNHVGKKLEKTIERIKSGKLTKMEYFRSEFTEDQKTLEKVPLFLVGADPRVINELASLWLLVNEPSDSHNKPVEQSVRELKVKLAKHRVSVLMLREVVTQLEEFSELAEKYNQPEVVEIYQKLLTIIKGVLAQKNISKTDEQQIESDDVFLAIRKELNRLQTGL